MTKLLDEITERIGSSSSLQKIRFGRGVVGKLAGIGMITVVAFAYMSKNVPPDKAFVTVVISAGIVFLVLFSIVLIALAKPELAVLEGMELVHYKRVAMAAKNFRPDKELPPIPDPGLPKLPEGDAQ